MAGFFEGSDFEDVEADQPKVLDGADFELEQQRKDSKKLRAQLHSIGM